jgi:hypothetical protein
MTIRGTTGGHRLAANLHVSRPTRQPGYDPLKAVAPVRIRSGLLDLAP